MSRTNNSRTLKAGIAMLAGSVMALGSGPAQAADSLVDALTGGKPVADLRLRYESVDQAGFAKDADALTLRTRVGYGTGTWQGLSAAFAFENI